MNLSLVNDNATPLRIQIQSAPDAAGAIQTWCVEVQGSGGFYPWTQFNTQCWAPTEGVVYNGEPVSVVAVTVVGNDTEDRDFSFCLNKITPSGDVCVGPPVAPPSGDGMLPGGMLPGDGVIGVVDGVPGVDPGAMGDGDGVTAGDPATNAGDGVTSGTGALTPDPNGALSTGTPASRRAKASGCSVETASTSGDGSLAMLLGLLVVGALSRRRG